MNSTLTLLPALLAALLPAAPHDDSWVDRRVASWQPTARERKWEAIGWANTILGAEKLAKQHNRAVFLFTHDGRLGIGRC